MVSLGFTWIIASSQGKGKPGGRKGKREHLVGEKGKGKGADPEFGPISTLQPDCAHARTNERNETKRFPGWTHPPTSDKCSEGQCGMPHVFFVQHVRNVPVTSKAADHSNFSRHSCIVCFCETTGVAMSEARHQGRRCICGMDFQEQPLTH